jgi:hypothetical protein
MPDDLEDTQLDEDGPCQPDTPTTDPGDVVQAVADFVEDLVEDATADDACA